MEPLDGEEIPLYSPRPEALVSPETKVSGQVSGAGKVSRDALASASQRVAKLCAAGDEWEIMENDNDDTTAMLCFSNRDRPCCYRIAGRLGATAAHLIANLKDNTPKGTLLLETEHLKTFGENVERIKHHVRLPGPWMGTHDVEGLQQCIFMEDSNRYLYVFVTDDDEPPPLRFLLGVWIRELDQDTGSEVEAVFEWQHTSPGLRTAVSDLLLENVWITAENLVEWAQYFTK